MPRGSQFVGWDHGGTQFERLPPLDVSTFVWALTLAVTAFPVIAWACARISEKNQTTTARNVARSFIGVSLFPPSLLLTLAYLCIVEG